MNYMAMNYDSLLSTELPYLLSEDIDVIRGGGEGGSEGVGGRKQNMTEWKLSILLLGFLWFLINEC